MRIERALLRRSFDTFVKRYWDLAEPTRTLLESVAVDGVAFALQHAADDGGRWAISLPPGVGKSLLASVLWPAWLLLRTDGKARIMCASYSWELATRDSVRCRSIVEHPRYQALVGGAWVLRHDRNQLDDWWTTAGGRRLVASVGGKALGERVTHQVIDDALGAQDAHSEAKRREAARFVCETLPTRLDDPENACRVIIGQRLHPDDPMGVALDRDPDGWIHVDLPALLAEGGEPCILEDENGVEIWRDSRTLNQPLVSLLGVDALTRLKIELGSAAFAAQYMQRPHDESASMFKRTWLQRRWTELPDGLRKVITLDASFKEGDSSDFAVIQCWGAKGSDRFLVEQWRRQAGFGDTLAALRAMRERHPLAKVLVEGAANGHAVLDQIRREMPGVIEVKPAGGKVSRAASVQAIVESGAIVLPAAAPWTDEFVDEVATFGPSAKHDDQVDAMTYALRELQASPATAWMRVFA